MSASSPRRRGAKGRARQKFAGRVLTSPVPGFTSGITSGEEPLGRLAAAGRRSPLSRQFTGFQIDTRKIVELAEAKLPANVVEGLDKLRKREENGPVDGEMDFLAWELHLEKPKGRPSHNLLRSDSNTLTESHQSLPRTSEKNMRIKIKGEKGFSFSSNQANHTGVSMGSTNNMLKGMDESRLSLFQSSTGTGGPAGLSLRRPVYQTNAAEALGIGTHVKDLQQRHINFRQRQPTPVSHIPLMRESGEQKLLRENNARRGARSKKNALAAEAAAISSLAIVPIQENQSHMSTSMAISGDSALTSRRDGPLPVDKTKFRMDEEIVTKMMMELDAKQLQLVKRDFNEHGGELNLHEFVGVMMKYQPEMESYDAEVNAVAKLCEFFDQVDINGDQSMELQEFTGYIVESSQDRDNFRVDNIKRYDPSPIAPIPSVTYDTRVDHVYYIEELDHLISCDTNRMLSVYEASNCSLIKRASGHKGVIHGVSYLQGRGASSYLATVANDSTLGFWDTQTYSLCQQVPCADVQMSIEWGGAQHDRLFTGGLNGNINVWSVENLECVARLYGHDDIVMDLHSIESMGVIASASLDSHIKFWDVPTQTLRKSLPGHAKGAFSLAYAPEYRFLISAGFDHDALVWNPYVERLITPLKGHNSSLVGVKAIPNTPEIITADNEGFFKIWDIRNFSCVQTFSMNDAKGSEGAAIFANPLSRVAEPTPIRASQIGAIGNGGETPRRGFRGNSSTSKSERMQGDIRENIENRRNLASSLLYNHSLRMSDIDTAISCFTYSTKHRRIVAANHDVRFFDYDRPTDPKLTDTSPTIGVIFNESALTFTTAAGRSVKLWDAESGRLIRIYRDISRAEITALCFDGRKRKFITGDHEGRITVFNLANGARMKNLSAHASEIVALHSLAGTQRIISSSWDGVIKVSDESDPEAAVVLMEINHRNGFAALIRTIPGAALYQERIERNYLQLKKKQLRTVTSIASFEVQRDVTAIAYSKAWKQIATAALDTTICLFNGETGATEALCVGHEIDVCALRYLEPYPYLVSGDANGKIFIWRTHPVTYKTLPWISFYNEISSEAGYAQMASSGDDLFEASRNPIEEENHTAAITCMEWDSNTNTLFVGDELGSLHSWNLSQVLSEAIEYHQQQLSRLIDQASRSYKTKPITSFSQARKLASDKSPLTQVVKEEVSEEANQSFFMTEDSFHASNVETVPTPPETDRKNNDRPSVRVEIAKLKNLRVNRLARAGRNGRLLPQLKLQWTAHSMGVHSIHRIEELNVLATSSVDRMVHLWTTEGSLMGSLLQGSAQDHYVDPNWRIPVDRAAQYQETIAHAREVLDAIAESGGRVRRIADAELISLANSSSESSMQHDAGPETSEHEMDGRDHEVRRRVSLALASRPSIAKIEKDASSCSSDLYSKPKKENQERPAVASKSKSTSKSSIRSSVERSTRSSRQKRRTPIVSRLKLAPELKAAADKLYNSLRPVRNNSEEDS